MAYSTVRDVLRQIRDYYQRIDQALDAAEYLAPESQVAAAIVAIREEEDRVAVALSKNDDEGSDLRSAGGTWIQYTPEEKVEAVVERFEQECAHAHSLDDLQAIKLEFDDEVAKMMSTLAEQVRAPSVREKLDRLAEWFATRARQDSWSLRVE